MLVEVPVDDLPPNILLMRILESMKSAPRPALSHPGKPSHTVPHLSQPSGRPELIDGPPLTQAPPPPSLQSFSSTSHIGSFSTTNEVTLSSGGHMVGFAGGGSGVLGGSYGGSVISGNNMGGGGGYGGSLGREGGTSQVGMNAAVSGVSSLGNLSLSISTSSTAPAKQPTLLPSVAQQRQVSFINIFLCILTSF